MSFKISHIRGATTHRSPVEIGGPAAPAKPAARTLSPAVAGLLRRLSLDAPVKSPLHAVDAAFAKSGMNLQARMRGKAKLQMAGLIHA